MSLFAPHPSLNAWKDIIVSRFSSASTDETALARTGLTGAEARTALLESELEILQHPDFISFARRKRNDSRPACNLPAEVIARIFWFAQSPQLAHSVYAPELTIQWISVSYVCSKWREVALTSSELWCSLSCYAFPPRALPDIIARSQEQKLDLVFGEARRNAAGESPYASALRETYMSLPICQRIRTLLVYNITAQFETSGWLSLLRNPMPWIEVIKIHIHHERGVLVLPADMGSTPSPSPYSIILSGCVLPWTSSLFNVNIQHLDLSSGNNDPQPLLHFCDALQRMPALKKLKLWDVFPNFTSSSEDVICLEHLEFLDLFASLPNVVNCLSTLLLLKLPQKLCCTIYIPREVGSDLMRRAIAHVFQTTVAQPQSLYIGRKVLSTVSSSQVVAITDVDMATEKMYTEMLPEERRISGGTWDVFMPHLSCVEMSTLRHVTVTADVMQATADVDSWRAMFSSANQVHDLVLEFAPPLLSLLRALTDTSIVPDSQTASMSIFPALETLTLHNEYDTDNEPVLPIIVDEGNSVRLQFALLEFVQKRRRCEAPFKRLVVEENIMDDQLLRTIQGVVEVKVVTLYAE